MKQYFKIGDKVQVNIQLYDENLETFYCKSFFGIIIGIYKKSDKFSNTYYYNINFYNGSNISNMTVDRNQIIMKI